jgi:hypothetical protein
MKSFQINRLLADIPRYSRGQEKVGQILFRILAKIRLTLAKIIVLLFSVRDCICTVDRQIKLGQK